MEASLCIKLKYNLFKSKNDFKNYFYIINQMILFLYLKWENNGKYNIIFMIFISTRLAFTCINCAILLF